MVSSAIISRLTTFIFISLPNDSNYYGSFGQFSILDIIARFKNRPGYTCQFKSERIATDKDNNIVFLAESEWVLRNMIEAYPEIKFHITSEFKREMQEAK